jgi:hypothetical protein
MRYLAFSILFMLSFLVSCQKIEHYSDQPDVSFVSLSPLQEVREEHTDFEGNYQTMLRFDFRDGMGDIGYRQRDSLDGPGWDTSKIYLTKYVKRNSGFLPADTDSYQLPYMFTQGSNRTLEGTIELAISVFSEKGDTIRYEFFIVDRGGRKSNVETSSSIVYDKD